MAVLTSPRLAPSILSADFLNLGADLTSLEVAGADVVHFDVMDGVFVPNISIGLPVLAAVRRGTSLPIDVHLMITQPERYLASFVEAGADALTVHVEGATHLHRTLSQIRDLGAKAGVAINPATPANWLSEVLPMIDQVLVMSVNPGFGGQSFIESQLAKIATLRVMLDAANPQAILAVDGGVHAQNVAAIIAAGADQVIAGSAVFNQQQTVDAVVANLRRGMQQGWAARHGAR